jgi:hypothetical protein
MKEKIMSLGELVVIILAVATIVYIGGYVVRTLWATGGRNELEELAHAQKEFEKARKDLFD